MGNFEDHIKYGAVSSLLIVLVCVGILTYLRKPFYGAVAGGFALPSAFLGAGFPDIDHHSSKPHRWFKKGVLVSVTLVMGYFLLFEARGSVSDVAATLSARAGEGWKKQYFEIGTILGGALISGGIAYLLVGILKPKHRGITHTLGAGGVMALILGSVTWYAGSLALPNIEVAIFAGGGVGAGFFAGFLSHLQCDGMLFSFLPSY